MTRIGNPESEDASKLESETTFCRIGNHFKRIGNRLRTRVGKQFLSNPKLLETNRKLRPNLLSETWEAWEAKPLRIRPALRVRMRQDNFFTPHPPYSEARAPLTYHHVRTLGLFLGTRDANHSVRCTTPYLGACVASGYPMPRL